MLRCFSSSFSVSLRITLTQRAVLLKAPGESRLPLSHYCVAELTLVKLAAMDDWEPPKALVSWHYPASQMLSSPAAVSLSMCMCVCLYPNVTWGWHCHLCLQVDRKGKKSGTLRQTERVTKKVVIWVNLEQESKENGKVKKGQKPPKTDWKGSCKTTKCHSMCSKCLAASTSPNPSVMSSKQNEL